MTRGVECGGLALGVGLSHGVELTHGVECGGLALGVGLSHGVDVSQFSVQYKYVLWARPAKVRC
jgi:hypothetical protein